MEKANCQRDILLEKKGVGCNEDVVGVVTGRCDQVGTARKYNFGRSCPPKKAMHKNFGT